MAQVSLGPWPLGQDDPHLLSDEVYQRRESAKGSKPARARRLENWTLLEDGTLLTAPGTRPVVEESADLRAAVSWAGLLLVQIGTELHRVTDLAPWTTALLAEGLEEPARFCPWDDQTLLHSPS